MPKISEGSDMPTALDDLIEELHQLNADGRIEYDDYCRLHALASAPHVTVDPIALATLQLALNTAETAVAYSQGDSWTSAQKDAHNRLRRAAATLLEGSKR